MFVWPSGRRHVGRIPVRRFCALLGLLVAGAFAACSPPKLFVPPDDAFTDAGQLLAEAAARRSSLQGLAAESRVEYYGAEGVRKGKVVIAIQRPVAVRFEALSPTGDFLALLTSDGTRFASFQRGDGRCYEGPPCPANVGRLLPIGLPGDSIVSLLLGEAPLIPHETAEVAFNRETGRYDVTLVAPGGRERELIAFDTEDLAAREATVWREGDLLFRLSFDSLERAGDVRLPTRIRFRMPAQDVDLTIAYRDIERDPTTLTPEGFRFDCPAGAERWWLACDGSPARPGGAPPATPPRKD